jgi:hypothetical protein
MNIIISQFKWNGTTLLSIIPQGGEGKAFPLQTWTGPEGSRRLTLPDFKTIGT